MNNKDKIEEKDNGIKSVIDKNKKDFVDSKKNNITDSSSNNDSKKEQNDPAKDRLQDLSRRGLNAATGGRWDKLRNAPIVGNAAKKAEAKAADAIGKTKLGQKLGQQNHQKPNVGVPTKDAENGTSESKKTDVGKRNLRTSLKNKTKNLWEQRKRKNGSDSKEQSEEEKKEGTDSTEESESSEENTNSNIPINEKKLVKIRMMINIALIGLFFFALYFLVMLIGVAIAGDSVFKSAPVMAMRDYGTDSFQAVTPEDSEAHKYEIEFYEKMNEIESSSEGDVDINFVKALLLQVFYDYDAATDYNDEAKIKIIRDSGGIDYAKMTENVDKFMKVIKEFASSDYSIGGEIYNALKYNDEFNEYYKGVSEYTDVEVTLKGVFDLYEALSSEDAGVEETTITDETSVTVIENDNSQIKTKTMSVSDYISGSIYSGSTLYTNAEMIKAYTIAYSTNIVANNKKLTINSSTASISGKTCSITLGCSYDANGDLVDGPGIRSNKNVEFYNGSYYYKKPLSSDDTKNISSNINTVFGNVLVNSDGTYPKLDLSKLGGLSTGDYQMGDLTNISGMDYKTILAKAYGDNLKIKNVGEGSYVSDIDYGTEKVKADAIFYDQNDYGGYSFCGLKNSTIKSSGCGITAMAIVVSTYEGSHKYDPIEMNNVAYKKGLCGVKYDGTAQAFFGKVASDMGYKYKTGNKKSQTFLKLVLQHLRQKHLVVIHVGAGHFTKHGHYMVLGGIDPETKKVYVYDPNDRSNANNKDRRSGNGWYSFNDIIVPETKTFYIIWKG